MCQAVLSHIFKKDKTSFRLCEKLKKITNDEGGKNAGTAMG